MSIGLILFIFLLLFLITAIGIIIIWFFSAKQHKGRHPSSYKHLKYSRSPHSKTSKHTNYLVDFESSSDQTNTSFEDSSGTAHAGVDSSSGGDSSSSFD